MLATLSHSITHFLNMGGYWEYVWPAYGIGFLLFTMPLIVSRRRYRQLLKHIRSLHAPDT